MKSFLQQLWSGWLQLTKRLGDFQARWILTVFYFTVVLPFGLITRVFLDPLNTHHVPTTTAWNIRSPREDGDLTAAEREF